MSAGKRKQRYIEGFVTVKELRGRLQLPDTQTILLDVKRGRLTAYRLPAQRHLRNAPYYFRKEEADRYIEEWHIPQPVGRN